MNWETIDRSCESTPFVLLSTPAGTIRLFWTLRAGIYGHQVCAAICPKGGQAFFTKTTGCGYSKAAHALGHAFRVLGYAPRGFSLGGHGQDGLHPFHKGGNFYSVPKRHWLKIKKGA